MKNRIILLIAAIVAALSVESCKPIESDFDENPPLKLIEKKATRLDGKPVMLLTFEIDGKLFYAFDNGSNGMSFTQKP